MELRSCIIVSGGRQDTLPHAEGAFVIACDRGLAYCMECGIKPDLFVGDFDSYHGAVPAGVACILASTCSCWAMSSFCRASR